MALQLYVLPISVPPRYAPTDGYGRFDMPTGRRLAKKFEQFQLMFFEEPVPAENVKAMRDVRDISTTPI